VVSASAQQAKQAVPLHPSRLSLDPVDSAVNKSVGHLTMECPKCGFVQKVSTTCISCGVIFAKFHSQRDSGHGQLNTSGIKNKPVSDRVKKPLPVVSYVLVSLALICGLYGKFYLFDRSDMTIIGHSSMAQEAGWMAYNNVKYSEKAFDIHDYLEDGDYVGLERELLNKQNQVISDVEFEFEYWDIFTKISLTGVTEYSIDNWIAATDSPWAYAVKGIYKIDQGLVIRGSCFAKCVSDQQFESQATLTRAGVPFLLKALEKDSQILAAYKYLMISDKTSGARLNAREVLDRATTIFPASFHLRDIYMMRLSPRWGGNFVSMSQYAEEQQQYVHLNSRILSLQGSPFAHKAFWAKRSGNCEEVVGLLELAFQYGVRSFWAYDYGYCMNELAVASNVSSAQALEIFERALEFIELSIAMYDEPDKHEFKKLVELNIKKAKSFI
jgi:hypothetical protein